MNMGGGQGTPASAVFRKASISLERGSLIGFGAEAEREGCIDWPEHPSHPALSLSHAGTPRVHFCTQHFGGVNLSPYAYKARALPTKPVPEYSM